MRLYVDPAFAAAPGDTVVFAAGTAHWAGRQVYGTTAFKFLADAYAAASPGDTLVLAAGDHQTPGAWAKTLDVVGVDPETVLLSGDPPVGGYAVTVAGPGVLVRFRRMTLVAPPDRPLPRARVTSGARAAFVYCAFADADGNPARSVYADRGGAAVLVGCQGVSAPAPGPAGAVGSFPPPPAPAGGSFLFSAGQYPCRMTLEAPARGASETGQSTFVWVPVCDFRARYDPQRSYEGVAGRVFFENTTGYVFCRGALPVTPDMRLNYRGRTLQVTGVAAPETSAVNELAVGVSESRPGE